MATTYKILGQVAPSATTETDLYTVPAATEAIISSLIVANRGTSSGTFRIAVSVNGAATSNKDYVIYDAVLSPNSTQAFSLGLTADATDKIKVYASSADFSFSAFGTEIA